MEKQYKIAYMPGDGIGNNVLELISRYFYKHHLYVEHNR